MTDTSAPLGGAASSSSRPRPASPSSASPASGPAGSTAYRTSAPSSASAPASAPSLDPARPATPTGTETPEVQGRSGSRSHARPSTRGIPAGVHRPGYEPGSDLSPAPAPKPAAPQVRRAHLTLSRIDPWSAMKVAFTLSIAVAIVLVVAIGVLWFVLDAAGVFASIERTVSDVAPESSTLSVSDVVAFPRVMGFSLLVAVIEVVLVTAVATLAAFLYNISVGMVGGLEVTLSEEG